jgi:hypothetical protein
MHLALHGLSFTADFAYGMILQAKFHPRMGAYHAGRDKARATPRFIGASRRFSRVERETTIGLAFPRPRMNPGSITALPRAGAQ